MLSCRRRVNLVWCLVDIRHETFFQYQNLVFLFLTYKIISLLPPIIMIIEQIFMNQSYSTKISSAPLWSNSSLKFIKAIEKLRLHCSYKNISLPSKKYLKLQLMNKIDKIIKQMRWKTFFYRNGNDAI